MLVERDISLANLTSLRVGGKARSLARVKTVSDLRAVLEARRGSGAPFFVLGEGTNILASDDEFEGVIVKMELRGRGYSRGPRGSVLLTAAAGENLDRLVAETVRRGLSGLENLSGIPGTVGATPIQNVGAYGAEVKDLIESVEVFDAKTLSPRVLTAEECGFRYRDSVFKRREGERFIITRVRFRLSERFVPDLSYPSLGERLKGRSPTLSAIRRAVLEIRRGKFPDLKTTGTAGSFFKNPIVSRAKFAALKKRFPSLPGWETDGGVKIPLAWILDRVLSLRGHRAGAVELFAAQPLVLVHRGGGTAREIDAFAGDIASRVYRATRISVSPEVVFFNWRSGATRVK